MSPTPPSIITIDEDNNNQFPIDYVSKIINDRNNLALFVEEAIDWAHAHGLVIRTSERKDSSDVCQAAPFALFPSPFPRKLFDQALGVQKAMNLLYFRISWDYEFLEKAHCDVIQSDEFTQKMMRIMEEIHREGIKQPITLLTQRADYMCHVQKGRDGLELKQIEVNNIAVSMGGLSQRATKLHRRMLQKVGQTVSEEVVPSNKPIATLAEGIHSAWTMFGDPNSLMVSVVGEVNQNQIDQRYVEYELERLSAGQIKIVRLTLTECAKCLRLDENDFTLHLDNQIVSIVYFRSGYSPDDYPTDKEWEARRNIERSTAIKCPWIGLQLANTKKVQQVLALPGNVERFITDPPTVKAIRDTFAGMWGLECDDEATKAVIEDAIANPENYVLKPQLEGGGGNYFGNEIAKKLRSLTPIERAAHILMQKIKPLVVKNYLIRPFQQPVLDKVVSELGIYGCLVGNGRDLSVQHNQSHGHILRTKAEHVNEGGVAVGAAVIDTPRLF